VHIHGPQRGPTWFGGSSGDASVSLPPPVQPMTSTDPPPAALRHLTHHQFGTSQPINYKNFTATSTIASRVPSNYRSVLTDPTDAL
jgi:hypothetical protein